MKMNSIGSIKFGDIELNFYNSSNNPYFNIEEVYKVMGVSKNKGYDILSICENDDIIIRKDLSVYITECGLYTYIEATNSPISRKFRKVINHELIQLRRERNYDIRKQFQIWDERADDYFYDPSDEKLHMISTVNGGDIVVKDI